MEAKSSLSDNLRQLVILNRNALELWEKVAGALTTNQQNIVAELTDFDTNETYQVSIPSIKKMSNDIETLYNNFKSLSGLQNSATIKTPDGNFKKILTANLLKQPDSLTTITNPTTFRAKNNWFFESFINPLLVIDFDYTGILSKSVKRVEIVKYILALDTEEKQAFFNNNWDKQTNINYEQFIFDLEEQQIEYIVDRQEERIQTKESIYYGDFDVIDIYTDTEEIEVNGETEIVSRTKYRLGTLKYSSKLTQLEFTETLKVGDQLIVNKNDKNTKYEITEIDTARNTVVLKLIEGFDQIAIGGNSLQLFSSLSTRDVIEAPVGFNNYIVVFLRPIDNDSNIISDFYSPGTGLFTNTLTINLGNGVEQTLEQYYQEQVVDFGQLFVSLAKDTNPGATFGEIPDAPVLTPTSFKVVEINKHQTQKTNVKDLKKYQNEKNTVISEISTLDSGIKELTNKISTKNYSSTVERNTDLKKLETLNANRENKKASFNSLVNKINSLATGSSKFATPKYRIQGFWSIPQPKFNARTGTQDVVQFLVNYRYLSTDGDSNPVEKIKFVGNDETEQQGAVPEWVEVYTSARKKIVDEETGNYIWEEVNTEDSEKINPNQLPSIPIRDGEIVEIRVKSISSSGYPTNPLESEWSNTVQIEFPAELVVESSAEEIKKQAEKEIVKVQLDEELNSIGIKSHVNDSFPTSNGKFFKHKLVNLDSGFVDDNQNPIDAFTKLQSISNSVESIQNSLTGNVEKFSFKLVDESGAEYEIKQGLSNNIFAGYYKNLVENQTVKQGSIVTRVYKLVITNNANNALTLESLNKGNSNTVADIVNLNGVGYRYSEVPIKRQNSFVHQNQLKGQYIYNRYNNLFNNQIYVSGSNVGLKDYPSSTTASVLSNAFFAAPTALDPSALYVHEDHPDVQLPNYTGTGITLPDQLSIDNLQNSFNSTYKISFRENDKYLIGPLSTGAFLYIIGNDDVNSNLRVDGETIFSNKIIEPNESVSVNIVFQFRLTDYYGATDNNPGVGRIGGQDNLTNLTIQKTLGFDYSSLFGGQQGFDITFTCKYQPDGVTLVNTAGGNNNII